MHLFAGAGGGILADVLLGHRIIGAVEWEAYPCTVLQERISDGSLEPFPIFNMDIRDFNRRIAPRFRGVADIVAGGFPCPAVSVAGKREGAASENWLWEPTAESLRIIRPRWAYLENVPGLLSIDSGRLYGRVLRDLAALGYGHIRYGVLSAADVGAPHKRDRLWIWAENVADSEDSDWRRTA